jgi:hypothetical protein
VQEGFLAEDVAHYFFDLSGDGIGWDLHDLDGPAGSADHSFVIADDYVCGDQPREAFEELAWKRLRACEHPGVVDQLECGPDITLPQRTHRFTIRQ